MQPSFQEQVRKQMIETIAQQSPVDASDSRQVMEQLRSDEEHKCAPMLRQECSGSFRHNKRESATAGRRIWPQY